MLYAVYQITNLINNKIYIGVHQTTDLDDEYMGSGVYLNKAITKYGLENFRKDILFVFNNPKDMFAKEAELVNEDFVSRNDTYNAKTGGKGGWDYINTNGINLKSEAWKTAASVNLSKGSEGFISYISDDNNKNYWRERISISMKEHFKDNDHPWLGRKHSEETKEKQRIAAKNKPPEKTSGYGTCWIHNSSTFQPKKIKKIELEKYLSSGFSLGRKPK